MASQSLPSTPKASTSAQPVGPEASNTPGKWRHPQLSEIVRRQDASTFGDKNMRKLVWNGGALVVTWMFSDFFKA